MRLIDADVLPKYTGYALSATEVAKAVENAPTIEAEPNSCKYWDSESHFCALRRPQAEPERKTGRWILEDIPYTGCYRITCSECGEDATSTAPCIGGVVKWDYCPWCGAKMEDGE